MRDGAANDDLVLKHGAAESACSTLLGLAF
jgi:hypothetical protein